MGEIYYFVKGVIIGLSIAVPVGPIGILCIRRTLTQGRIIGFLSGLGAATADAFYGAIAGFGLTFLSNLLVGQQTGLRLIGGGLLCIKGVRRFFGGRFIVADPERVYRLVAWDVQFQKDAVVK